MAANAEDLDALNKVNAETSILVVVAKGSDADLLEGLQGVTHEREIGEDAVLIALSQRNLRIKDDVIELNTKIDAEEKHLRDEARDLEAFKDQLASELSGIGFDCSYFFELEQFLFIFNFNQRMRSTNCSGKSRI